MSTILPKSLNILNAGYSFLASSITGKTAGRWMPLSAGIELTNICNLRCPECLSGSGQMTRPEGFMDKHLFDRIIDELTPFLININLYFQGEPMMHPEFFDFINNTGSIRTTVSTNGHFLTPENAQKLARSGLNRLIVSLDGMDNHTYSLYRRNGDFEKVVSGIEYLSDTIKKTGSRLRLEIQFLVNRHNEDQIRSVKKFSKIIDADLRLKSMQIISNERIEEWLPEKKRFRRYEMKSGMFSIKSAPGKRCLRLWINPVITWDGKVVPCCFDKDAYHVMGNLYESTFREIWYGEKFMEFRKSLLTGRGEIEICRNCTTGLRGVKY